MNTLIVLPVMSVAHFLASWSCPFTIVCDPRDRKEDGVVRANVEALMALTKNAEGKDVPVNGAIHRLFRKLDHSRQSHDEIGLQLADLIAGETRTFFQANPDLMTFGAARKFINQASSEPIVQVGTLNGMLVKTGAETTLPSQLRKRLLRGGKNCESTLPLFRYLFAGGAVTCFSDFGQPRDIWLLDGLVWDQADS